MDCCVQFHPRRLNPFLTDFKLGEICVVYAVDLVSKSTSINPLLHYGPSTGKENPPIQISAYGPVP